MVEGAGGDHGGRLLIRRLVIQNGPAAADSCMYFSRTEACGGGTVPNGGGYLTVARPGNRLHPAIIPYSAHTQNVGTSVRPALVGMCC